MADFVLGPAANASTLGGGQFKTAPHDMNGDFREIQFHWTQTVANQDLELHFFEFHYAVLGVSLEDR